jgi:hypothetical protein
MITSITTGNYVILNEGNTINDATNSATVVIQQ